MFLDIVGEKGRTQKRKLDTKWHDDFERGKKLYLYYYISIFEIKINFNFLIYYISVNPHNCGIFIGRKKPKRFDFR